MASDEAATLSAPTANGNNGDRNENREQEEPIELNPRWMGYLCILMFSLINFISISNVPGELRRSVWAASMVFGVLTFVVVAVIVIQDRWFQKRLCNFNYTKSKNGYLEGYVLVFFVIWWIIGVAYITRPGGIAYTVGNIYYSAWLAVAACVYTLNEWSDSKDILNIAEIISVSPTLRYWWIHFTAAFVVFVSSIGLELRLGRLGNDVSLISEKRDALFGIFVGLLSLIISSFFLLVHYDFITCIEEGGWSELFPTMLLILVWIIALAIFTSSDGIAATTSGFDCMPRLQLQWGGTDVDARILNCTIIQNGITKPCRFSRYMPGSNLYFASWACMLSLIAVALKWKAAKALKFAESQAERQQKREKDDARVENYGVDNDDDDGDDGS